MDSLRLLLMMIVINFTPFVGPNDQAMQVHTSQPVAECSAISLQGSYDFLSPATVTIGQGTVIAIPDELLYALPAPNVNKGTLVFDGYGEVSLLFTKISQGQMEESLSYVGEYTINACSITATFSNDTRLAMKMVVDNEQLTLVSTTPGFVILRASSPSQQ